MSGGTLSKPDKSEDGSGSESEELEDVEREDILEDVVETAELEEEQKPSELTTNPLSDPQ